MLNSDCAWFWLCWIQTALDIDWAGYSHCARFWLSWILTVLDSDCAGFWLCWILTVLNSDCAGFWLSWILTVLDSDCAKFWLGWIFSLCWILTVRRQYNNNHVNRLSTFGRSILFCLAWKFDCTHINDQHTKLKLIFIVPQGFQIKLAAGGISVYSGHLRWKWPSRFIFSTLKIPYLTHWITTLLQVPVRLPDVRKSCFRASNLSNFSGGPPDPPSTATRLPQRGACYFDLVPPLLKNNLKALVPVLYSMHWSLFVNS
jgi:hypothetical protein